MAANKEKQSYSVVSYEAHKMAATMFGGEIHYTKRYQLGKMLSNMEQNLRGEMTV